jgi:bacterioferritin
VTQKAVEFLNKALRRELTAVNQYWLHYGCSTIGVTRIWPSSGVRNRSKKWSTLTSWSCVSSSSKVSRTCNCSIPLRIGQNVKEVLDCDLASEISARTLYQEATRTATQRRTM